MSSRIALVVILAEDLRSARFLRHYVKRVRPTGEVRLRVTPSGAGDQWVQRRYPVETCEQRRRVHGRNRNAALVVHIDADHTTVQTRLRQLDRALAASKQPKRGPEELIAIAVPKRHTETWLYGLCGEKVDEQYDCKRDPERRFDGKVDQRIGAAAEELFRLTRANAPPAPKSLPALDATIAELRRIE